jgi:alpha-1,3-rhamnosyl/mannosyltransferase
MTPANPPPAAAEPLRVALNATSLLSPATGIAQYTRSLAGALEAVGSVRLRYLDGQRWSSQLRVAPVPGIDGWKRAVKRLIPSAYGVARAAQQAAFSLGVRRHRPDVYHEPAFLAYQFSGPTVVTAFDLSWIRYPQAHPAARVRMLERYFPGSLARADHVITASQAVRAELIAEFSLDGARVSVIPLAARAGLQPRTPAECAAAMAARQLRWRGYLLSVGTLEPRKNLVTLLRAYAALDPGMRARLPLVIVGMKGWGTSPLEALVAPLAREGSVRILGYVDEAELAQLNAAARMLIYPSLYEGFGLPPLEAMASGTPVITSNTSSLPEVTGAAAVAVDPQDTDALRAAIARLAQDDQQWESLRSAGLAQAASFSWDRCARETIAVYRAAIAQRP